MEKDKKFTVKCDEENNPQSVIDNNELVVDVTITPNWPTHEEFKEYDKMMGEIDSWSVYNDIIPGIEMTPVFETRKEQDEFTEKFSKDIAASLEEIKNGKKKRL